MCQAVTRRALLRAGAATALSAAGAALLAACGGAAAVNVATLSSAATAASPATSAAISAGTAATSSASVAQSAATSASTGGGSTSAPTSNASSAEVSTSAASSAAAGPASSAARPGSALTIEWWSGWGSGNNSAKVFDQVAAAANQVLPGFQVRHEGQSSVAKKLATVIAAGTPPDVEVGNLAYPEFWAKGLALPLDSYLAKSKTIAKQDLFDASWTFGSYQGKTYGVPAVESFMRWGLLANIDLLAKRGLDPAALPTTWDTLLDWHKQLTVVDPGSKAITQLGLDPLNAMGGSASGGDPFFWGPSFGLGTKYYDEGAGKFNLATPELEAALTSIKGFYDAAGGYAALQTFRKTNQTWNGAKAGIVVGTEAMQINGYWTPGDIAKLVPQKKFTYTWAPVAPERKGTKMQSTGGHFAVLPKGASHPDQAFQVAEFLSGEQAERLIYEGTGWLGARKSFLSKIDPNTYPGLDFYLKSATTADELWADPVDPVEGTFADTWGTQATKVFQGQVTPKDALAELQRVCTEELRKRQG